MGHKNSNDKLIFEIVLIGLLILLLALVFINI